MNYLNLDQLVHFFSDIMYMPQTASYFRGCSGDPVVMEALQWNGIPGGWISQRWIEADFVKNHVGEGCGIWSDIQSNVSLRELEPEQKPFYHY
jgi:hypothetical protein